MTLRDDLLPLGDLGQSLQAEFGLSRFSVTIRRRVWSTLVVGEGTATDYDIAISPAPRVRDITSRDLTLNELELRAMNSNAVAGALYRIDKITPSYGTGGYLAEQLRLSPSRDTGAVENLVAIVGDDGYLRECEQVTFEQDRAFGYSMVVKEIDRPRTSLQSIAVSPSAPSLAVSATQQLTATGTFNGGATSILTTLCAWTTSDAAVATVDIYGKVTAVGAGVATITATALSKSATATVTVS